ncbi:MAG: hypothetical protein ACKO7X_05545, partial [Bacteroidota bacterium]
GATAASYSANTAGAYSVVVTNSSEGNGCSATSAVVNVIVKPNSSTTINAEICQGQTYTFGTQSLSTSGTYNRTVPSANGCDSIITLNLNVKPTAASSITASICQGQTYTFGSQTLTSSGTYTRNLIAANGCDSVITLNLNVKPTAASSITASICQGQTYTFSSQTLTSSGTYTNTLTAANGCDSVVTLNLTVLPNSSSSMDASICDGQSYSFGSQTLTTSGTYTNTVTAANGCDSVVTLNLTVLPNSSSSMDASICDGQSYSFGSQTLTTGGTYTNTVTAANGCDSMVTLNLTVLPNSSSSMDASICDGQSYTFGSQTLTTGGTYTNTVTAANGCDSVITLTLQVNPISNTNLNAEICQGSTYNFGSQSITTSGTYTLNLTNINGCDSIVNLELLVNPTYAQSIQASILFGNSYAFNGQNLTSPGTYTANLLTVKGCDSIITLTLNVTPPLITNIGNTTGCVGDTISIPVQVQYGNGIGAMSLALNYNASALSFIGFENANPAIQSSNLLVNA